MENFVTGVRQIWFSGESTNRRLSGRYTEPTHQAARKHSVSISFHVDVSNVAGATKNLLLRLKVAVKKKKHSET